MNKLYDEIDRKNKEIATLKKSLQELRDQVGCLVSDCMEKDVTIARLSKKIAKVADYVHELQGS